MTGPSKLRAWLKAEGMSMTAFAERIKVTHATVSDWLSKKKKPGYPNARKICRGTNEHVRPEDWSADYASE